MLFWPADRHEYHVVRVRHTLEATSTCRVRLVGKHMLCERDVSSFVAEDMGHDLLNELTLFVRRILGIAIWLKVFGSF